MTILLELPQVLIRTRLSQSTIYKRMNAGSFPPRVNPGKRPSKWRKPDVDAYLNGTWAPKAANGNGATPELTTQPALPLVAPEPIAREAATLRDYFAINALPAIITRWASVGQHEDNRDTWLSQAEEAYDYADAMLYERGRERG